MSKATEKSELGQRHDAQVVGGVMAGGVGRHVGEDQVGGAAEALEDEADVGVLGDVALEELGAGDRRDGEEVDADHLGGTAFEGDLGPAAGGGAEVEDAHAGLEEVAAVVELDELEGGAGAVAGLAGADDVGVVDLAGEPALLGERSALGGAQALAGQAQAAVVVGHA